MTGLVPDPVKNTVTNGGLVMIEWLKKPETRDTDNKEMLTIHADSLVTWARNHRISRDDLEENMTRITDERYGKRRTQRTPPPGKGGDKTNKNSTRRKSAPKSATPRGGGKKQNTPAKETKKITKRVHF